jgi:NAD+ synthase
MSFNPDVLKIDAEAEAGRIAEFIVDETRKVYRRTGIVVGLSGGIDSTVMASLAVHALGKERVVGLILPERESNPVSAELGTAHADALGIEHRVVDITGMVDAVCPYARRDEYIRNLIPAYTPECKYNISLPTDLLERDSFNFYVLRVQTPDGEMHTKRLDQEAFRFITAFASIKIRARMVQLYWEAERRSLVNAGTTNRTEMVLGDFAKYGDGGTDIEAIAHLYKDQVYQLGAFFDVLPAVMTRAPSPDTFSLPVTDIEFFFRIGFDKLDHLLWGWEHEVPPEDVSGALGVPVDGVKRAYRDFAAKNRATRHLRELAHTMNR